MYELVTGFFLSALIFYCCYFVYAGKLRLSSLLLSFAYAICLFVFAFINFKFEIFEQKFASEFAYDIFKGRESLRDNSGFLLQYFLNLPVFYVTNAWWSAIATNVVLATMVFLYALEARRSEAYILLAPVIVNFSMFALRDPIIGVLFFLLTIFLLDTRSKYALYKQLGTVTLFAISRPENVIVYVATKMYTYLREIKNKLTLTLILPILFIVFIIALLQVPKLLGMQWSGSLLDLPLAISDFYEMRANRWDTDEGGGSNILGGSLVNYPFFIRYPIQIFTFFVLPLPFEIKKVALGLAFVDSIFFCSVFYRFNKHAEKPAKRLFWFYVLLVAFFSNNYGNVFRIRLPAYFIMLAGLIKRD